MRKKNLSVKVAALAMSGTLAMAPMTVRADEATAAPVVTNTETTETTNSTAAPVAAPAATASAPAAGTANPAAGNSATASGTPANGTGATAGTAPLAPAAVSPDVITNSDGSISLREPAVASNTTVENNVKNVVTDDKQGTDISGYPFG